MKVMVSTQEDERKRISRDLHDDIGTKLSALKLFLSSLHEKASDINNREIESLAHSSEQFITEAMADVRQLLLNLSPTVLEEFGYATAVEGLVNKINETRQINFNLVVFGMKQRLQKDYELALYRITQELINNVLKHAEAKHVSLQIGQRDEKIILMMEDDGKGFDVNAHKDGYGLNNLAARTKLMQGTMVIDSNAGKGTSVLIEIPYNLNET
jgi:signal transduction histidine kinase